MSNAQAPEKIRLDKWLWAARFFKTRSLAADAISGGKIHVNEERAKPARAVHPGDEISIRKGPYKFVVTVLALSDRRGPATDAARLYEERADSRDARLALSEQLRLQNALLGAPAKGRPTKKARRQITRFTRSDDA